MSEMAERVRAHDRAFLEAWLVGATFPMAPTVSRLLAAHDALEAELASERERTTHAEQERDHWCNQAGERGAKLADERERTTALREAMEQIVACDPGFEKDIAAVALAASSSALAPLAGPLAGPLAETPDGDIHDYGDHPDHPDAAREAVKLARVAADTPKPPYMVLNGDDLEAVLHAIETGADHPYAIDGVPVVLASAVSADTPEDET